MLKNLSVSNLAVVERAEVSFAQGLNVVTGETGSGKSVLMGALDLVLGGRADASAVRDGAKEAEVVADFGDKVVRRVVSANGHSRAWVDDEAVSISDLRSITRNFVDAHGPRANQKLLEESFQRDALDSFGRIDKSQYEAEWKKLTDVRKRIAELESAESSEDMIDLLRYQVNELASAELSDNDDTLAERHAAAAHAEEMMEAANEVTETLGGDRGVTDLLSGIVPRVASIEKHLPAASSWQTEIGEIISKTEELSRTIADEISKFDIDPQEFQEMDSRLAVINRLKRKYLKGGGTVVDLLKIAEEKKSRLELLDEKDAKLDALRKEESSVLKATRLAGAALAAARRKAGEKFAKAVTKSLVDLGFAKAKFFVSIAAAEPSATGCDAVVWMFEPNPGESSRPLSVIASSGEIARVMLAVKEILSAHDDIGLVVFDEIDANIGGEVGRAVGEKLRSVAKGRQVIAITHLPQSAVYGERHLVVSKNVSGGRTRTSIKVVEGDERVKEIARMLGGEKLTSVVLQHAAELLTRGY